MVGVFIFEIFLIISKNVQKSSKLKFQKFGAFFVSLFHIVFGKDFFKNENLQLFKANELSLKTANQIGKELEEELYIKSL